MGFCHAFEIVTSVPDRGEAVAFYERLGFRWAYGGRPSGPDRVGDRRPGDDRPDRRPPLARAGWSSWSTRRPRPRRRSRPPGRRSRPAGEPIRWFSFVDPSGLDIVVVEATRDEAIARPGEAPSLCGAFGEISVLTPSADRSHAFWSRLGFEPIWFPPAPRRVGSMTDGVLPIGFYEPGTCPHVFRSPAITYFDEK